MHKNGDEEEEEALGHTHTYRTIYKRGTHILYIVENCRASSPPSCIIYIQTPSGKHTYSAHLPKISRIRKKKFKKKIWEIAKNDLVETSNIIYNNTRTYTYHVRILKSSLSFQKNNRLEPFTDDRSWPERPFWRWRTREEWLSQQIL